MSEPLRARLLDWLLLNEAVVAAHVLDTRGAAPRRRGAGMLVRDGGTWGSIGGGEAEARVVAAAQALLRSDAASAQLAIDLGGGPGAAGVCGGRMDIGLRAWRPGRDLARAKAIAGALAGGDAVMLEPGDLGVEALAEPWREAPDVRLLIVGGGHCGQALHRLAVEVDFQVWAHDARPECFADGRFPGATVLCGGAALLARALATLRPVFAVLLNRDFLADVAALEVLASSPPAFLGMMGSRRRIAQVRAALPHHADALANLHAPVGLDIDAQTPGEIAVSILAQLVAERRKLTQ